VEVGGEAEFIVEEWAFKGVTVLDVAVDVEQGIKEVFIFIGWWTYNSFSANIAS
jgi:hypothetical protein